MGDCGEPLRTTRAGFQIHLATKELGVESSLQVAPKSWFLIGEPFVSLSWWPWMTFFKRWLLEPSVLNKQANQEKERRGLENQNTIS